MVYFGGFLSIVFFIVAFQWFRVLPTTVAAAQIARSALASTGDASLTDDQKEALARKASLRLMGSFFSILFRGTLAVGGSALPLFAMQALGLLKVSAVVEMLLSWQALLVITAVLTPLYFLFPKKS